MPHSLKETLKNLPDDWPNDLLPSIRERVLGTKRTIVVLDDDPTGTQTVYDVPVLTSWDRKLIEAELKSGCPLFYILTNSRSLGDAEARRINVEIAKNLQAASKTTQRPFTVISRSDSTLRGHYPTEVDALIETLDQRDAIQLIVPFFFEGGRVTIEDIHYVAEGDNLVPAGETPFAHDATFGFKASNLKQWIEEKTKGKINARDVRSISIDNIRRGGLEVVTKLLTEIPGGSACVVNAVTTRDLEVVVASMLDAEAEGRRFIARTAASFVQVRAGLAKHPLLTTQELVPADGGGGLVIVGSYVPKTTEQLRKVLSDSSLIPVELPVEEILEMQQHEWEAFLHVPVATINEVLTQGKSVVLYTSRKLVKGRDAQSSLKINRDISATLISIVKHLKVRPRYLVAKGGVTSSDIATKALRVNRATVLGPLIPGVPVWRLGPESRYPDLSYVVFPGNVGGPGALLEAVNKLEGES